AGPLAGQSIIDIDVRADDPSRAVALTSTNVLSDSSTSSTYSQVFQTTDNGATWAPVGMPIDPAVLVQTIDVPKSDPSRIYVSGTRGFGTARTASLFVWTTASSRWTEQPIPQFDPSMEDSIYIAAVDPNNADRVYLRSSGKDVGGESRLFVTSQAAGDGGAVFTVPPTSSFQVPQAGLALIGELLGFALSQDGSKVYAGTKESGLWMASSSDLIFKQVNSHVHVQCLATRGSELWACSDAVSGFVAGVSTDDGATFTPKLCSITGLSGVVQCPASSAGSAPACQASDTVSQCTAAYNMFCLVDSTNGVCAPNSCGSSAADGGVALDADAAATAGGGDASASSGRG
ncbi:MAG: hypothetical protein ACREJ3_01700, partial [Polyangiaceae bacterium]